jgi:hypothetical protein
MEQGYTAAGIEPPLEELLNDRIAQLVMRRDRIALADVWRAVEVARSRLASRTQHATEGPREFDPLLEPPLPSGADRNTRSPAG